MTDKAIIHSKKTELLKLVDSFCAKHLDQEYTGLCHKVIEKLGRKRQVPFLSGRIEIWAAATIQAVGVANFLFDKSFKPFVSRDELNAFFSTSASTVSQKAKTIRDLLKIDHFNPDYATQHWLQTNPIFNLVEIDGFIFPKNLIFD